MSALLLEVYAESRCLGFRSEQIKSRCPMQKNCNGINFTVLTELLKPGIDKGLKRGGC